jgi:GNAT superfamily N-acetyltransferase
MPLKCNRTHISDDLFLLEKVSDFSITSNFDCRSDHEDEDLNDFFRNDAIHYKNALLAETYALYITKHKKEIGPLAFVALANDVIKLSKAQKKKLIPHKKRYIQDYPAVKIARLGVQRGVQGWGIGTYILNWLKTFFTTDNRTGCRFLTVDAYNQPRILKFYKTNEFDFLHEKDKEDRTRIMYYDLKRFSAARLPSPPRL